MGDIVKIIGKRIRNYRNNLGLSQEELAERCSLHPTYIGQLERGEKNPTIETIAKVSSALKIEMSTLFEKLEDIKKEPKSYSLMAYQIINDASSADQEKLFRILKDITEYKKS